MSYLPSASRYEAMPYKRCGRTGLKLPLISLGLWMNFGGVNVYENSRNMLFRAFDLGITHFDLANNYGPPYGSAEETFGRVMESDLRPYRDEMVISTKAGYDMWPGPYGNWGSRKYLISSLDQSLKRMKLDYVDIFYHHRPDPETPVEESMMALDQIVRSGKALYAGISNYSAEQTQKAVKIMKELGTPFIIHQAKYNMFNRWIEDGLLDVLDKSGMGCIVFSPLAQGLLTDKYLKGIPEGSRASKSYSALKDQITDDKLRKLNDLNDMAKERNQTLAQMALAWTLRLKGVTSTLIGASRVEHIDDAAGLLKNASFSEEEIKKIDSILYSL
ncbi:MAG TPA: L-glyceraldehyde 3-phosphate reductase [Ignavibacteriales bacterium]|nr:L-glyceraldehyde 3-phosphate reductase [Ignavibacteriales bacterium]